MIRIGAGIGVTAVIVTAGWFLAADRPITQSKIRVGVDHSPPYYVVNADGSVEGLGVDVLNEAARRRGIQLIWKPLHDVPLDDALSQGMVDIWPLVGPTPERKAKFFLSKPWLETEYVLASVRQKPVRNPAEAAGKVVAHARLKFTNLIAREYLARSQTIVKPFRADAVQAVCTGEAAAVLVESQVLDAILLSRPAGCERVDFEVAALTGATTPLSIAAVPGARAAAKTLRDEITALNKSGFLSAKLDEWSPFSGQETKLLLAEEAANERSRIYVYCLLLILVFSSILARVAYRGWRLKMAAARAEAGRREIQRRFTAFMDNSPAISFMKDSAGRLLYANAAWSKVFGLRPEDCYGRSDYELLPRTIAQQIREVDEAVLATDAPREVVESIPVSMTESRELLVMKFPFSSEGGERFVGGTAIDITERETTLRELGASESRYRELFENNPLPAWVYDRETLSFLTVNAAAVSQYGWTREDFLSGMTMAEIHGSRRREHGAITDEDLAASGSCTHVTKEGVLLTVDVTSFELEYEHVRGRLMIVRDLTEQEQMLERLRISEERWQLALRGAGDALWDWDVATGRVFRSPRWFAMLGYEECEIGDTREDLVKIMHPDDVEEASRVVEAHLGRETAAFLAEYRLRHKDGTWRWILDRGQAIWDERGRAVRMAGSNTDITERKAAEDLLSLQARTDALTGVANRREFDRLLAAQFRMARERAEPLTVCLCDLDHFKAVNDDYGHAAGDRVLIAFTEILRRNLRKTDTLARMGGDEFVLALPGTSGADSCVIMDRIREQLRQTRFISADGAEFAVTSSFGVAELVSSHANCEELIREADRCLYEAKGSGRNRTLAA